MPRIILYLKWFPSSEEMSEEDFIDQCSQLDNVIRTHCSSVLFIDAIDLKYEPSKQFIRKYRKSPIPPTLKWIGYVLPQKNKRMHTLIKKMDPNAILLKYERREDLLYMYQQTLNI
jgi:hypothetical protein